jgi:copper chaperone NosL
MQRSSRIAVAAVSLLLLAVYVTPLWRIELIAPQYPEGLGLRIWVNQITGLKPNDLNSINGLNHYIGMRAIEPDAIPELRLMPRLLACAIVAGLLVAILGRRGALYGWAALFTVGAVAGLGDFWKWGYEYGHRLDPHAAIKVPGMSYQPPVVGSKQLLNFHATSWPDVGGWIAIGALACVIVVAVIEWRRARHASALAAPGRSSDPGLDLTPRLGVQGHDG